MKAFRTAITEMSGKNLRTLLNRDNEKRQRSLKEEKELYKESYKLYLKKYENSELSARENVLRDLMRLHREKENAIHAWFDGRQEAINDEIRKREYQNRVY